MTGKVVLFFTERAYGFIYSNELRRRVFFHISEFSGAQTPEADQIVTFSLAPGKEGQPHKAVNVVVQSVTGFDALKTSAAPFSEVPR